MGTRSKRNPDGLSKVVIYLNAMSRVNRLITLLGSFRLVSTHAEKKEEIRCMIYE